MLSIRSATVKMVAERRKNMDQIKIGKFIAERRREVGLTQMQLAESLGITDRAVSKWECGRALPDSSIMLELCGILKITVNDLLSGEVITMDNYNKEMENNLISSIKEKEAADKMLLRVEMLIAAVCIGFMLVLCAIARFVELEEWVRITLIVIGLAPIIVLMPFMIRIEQTAGYYVCGVCGHRHVPKYISVFGSMHIGTTRYLKCPKCGKKSWQKKVLSRDTEN